MPFPGVQFCLVAATSVLLTSLSKGGFGPALGAMGVPLMSLVMPPTQAAAILLPLLCLMDVFGLRAYFGKWDGRNLAVMLPGALLGIAAGAIGFDRLSDRPVRMLVGGLAVAFAVLDARPRAAVRDAVPGRCVRRGVFWSFLSGFTSFVAHAGGPPAMIYLLPQRLDKDVLIGTAGVFFMVVNAIKLLPYAWLGQFDARNLDLSLLLAPLVPVGVYLGVRLQRRLTMQAFYRICRVALMLVGVQLIVEGVS